MVTITNAQVWKRLRRASFMVLGVVTARGQARTFGVVPTEHNGELWFASVANEWKVRHIRANPDVSVTVPVQRAIPPIPPATITFPAHARLASAADAPAHVVRALTRGIRGEDTAAMALVSVRPTGDFVTYGIGVSLLGMLDTEKARGRVGVREVDE